MIEIIPNWHPIFVHFTIALFSAATAFYALYFISQHLPIFQRLKFNEFEIVARWCLWIAGLITMATIGAGLYAYYTVRHDALSHEAMIKPRDWAICAAIAVFLSTLWSVWLYIKQQSLTLTNTINHSRFIAIYRLAWRRTSISLWAWGSISTPNRGKKPSALNKNSFFPW